MGLGNEVIAGGEYKVKQRFLRWEKLHDVYMVVQQRENMTNILPTTITNANLTDCQGKDVLISTRQKCKLNKLSHAM